MKLLTIETSSKICGVCLSENDKLIDMQQLENGLTHSESLMPLIKNLLEKNKLKISDFDAFVCDIGPGSFTGIRIGIATVKAFVDSLTNVKYTGVNSLETLAYNSKKDGLICSIINANNDNCYYSLYNFEDEQYKEIIPPTADSISEMCNKLKEYSSSSITFIGDGAVFYKKIIEQNIQESEFLPENLNKINTFNLALAGYKKILNNNIIEFNPMYLKKPQAERLLEEKQNSKS